MKRIFITGSTDGIGKLTALQLAKAGNEVIIHGRNAEKVDRCIVELKEDSGNERISSFVADLSDLAAVKAMANEIKSMFDSLDVLINNAGVFQSTVDTDKNGIDIRLTVNYLAPVLLTDSLKSLLENSSAPRVINLSSAAQSPVSLAALSGNESLGVQSAYAQSKLALTMWSFDLAKKWSFATVIAVNPGSLLNTRMVQEAYGQFWSSAEKGANILSDLATLDIHADHSGDYFDNDQGAYGPAHTDAYDADRIEALMSLTHQILGIK